MLSCLATSPERVFRHCLWPVWGLLLLFSATAAAQQGFQLRIVPQTAADSTALGQDWPAPSTLSDTSQVVPALLQLLDRWHSQSFLEAAFDSIARQDSSCTAWLHLGPAYGWASLTNGNVEPGLLEKSGFRQRLFRDKPFRFEEAAKWQERILQQAENNGFPFAKVHLDSIVFGEKTTGQRKTTVQPTVSAQLFLEKGPFVRFDSLTVEGDVKISQTYLRQYLGIFEGEPYSRQKVLKIRGRLQSLPFLAEQKNATVQFLGEKASVRLSLDKKRASRFDFLLGVLPSNNRPDQQRLLVTGTFNAEFHNQFGRGERIYAAFERLRPQTQRLEVAFSYPYLLQLPFGVDFKFNQYRRDSTYTDVNGEFGVQYLFEGGNYLKAFWNTLASNLLAVDTLAIRQGRPPDQLDVKNGAFGLELNWSQLDYRFNPRKGWSAWLKGSAGTRRIQPNQAILNVSESFYDTLPGRAYRFGAQCKLEKYFPVMERSTLKLAVQGGGIFSDQPIYQNEQYRIGGSRLLRGFDEEGVFATLYGVSTLEYRLLIGQNSFFYVFGDAAHVADRRAGMPDVADWPLGLGGGLSFETTAGVFGISLAVGKTQGTAVDFRNPKVHFGYVSVF